MIYNNENFLSQNIFFSGWFFILNFILFLFYKIKSKWDCTHNLIDTYLTHKIYGSEFIKFFTKEFHKRKIIHKKFRSKD